MRSWKVYLKQTKHENLGDETVPVLNIIMHCIYYTFFFASVVHSLAL